MLVFLAKIFHITCSSVYLFVYSLQNVCLLIRDYHDYREILMMIIDMMLLIIAQH